MTTLEQLLEKRPVDRESVENYKQAMLSEVRAYKLRELREERGLTQVALAERIGVSQRQISKIESGQLDKTQVCTIRRYLEALGGQLSMDFVYGNVRIQVA